MSCNRKSRNKQSHCFVPGCTTGYRSNSDKLSLFSVPKNAEVLETWKKAIPRADRELDEFSSVCELHFEEDFIERHYKHIIHNEEVLIPRGKPVLKPEAIPTKFPDLPHYLSKKAPIKRKTKNSVEGGRKFLKIDEPEIDFDVQNMTEDNDIESICNIALPSQVWTKIHYEKNPNIISFCAWRETNLCALPCKRVDVEKLGDTYTSTGYVKNISLFTKPVESKTLEGIIKELDKYVIHGWSWYNFRCHPIDMSESENAVKMTQICWVFFISKLAEFCDTIFFVLRKKYNQISFLHVFHHSTVPITAWYGINYGPGGYNIIFPTANSFVHIWMYLYYGLSAMGPGIQKYLWWKKYLTKLQLVQFLFVTGYFLQLYLFPKENCGVSQFLVWLSLSQAIVYFMLFLHFYIRSYGEKTTKNGPHVHNGDSVDYQNASSRQSVKKIE